ncbi:MAG TPA: kelch repeat-containing protein [Candidatus Eremiobacteraceae bacterium]|nr:kelch repeat-containing protein [Candidatus Eremiobacteraceae bacterium]
MIRARTRNMALLGAMILACTLVSAKVTPTATQPAPATATPQAPPATATPSQSPDAVATPIPQPSDLYRDAPDLNKGVWVRGPSLPSPRQDAAAVVLAGRIYLIGGFGPRNQQMDTTLVWEPQVVPGEPRGEAERAGSRFGVWTYAARIPEPVDHAAAAVVGGSIYVLGGRIENLVTNKFWRYDAGTDTWTELPSMPIPRFGPTMQAVGERLYVIGGAISHGADATSMMVYDIPSATWARYEYAVGNERQALQSALIDDKIAIVGGRDDQERNLPFCDIFDPLRGRWQTCMGLHQARSDFGLSVVNGRLIATGGENLRAYQPTQTMEISEPGINGWLSGPWLPSPRHGMSQVTLGNVVWVIGGASSTGTAPSSLVLRYVSPLIKIKFRKGHA